MKALEDLKCILEKEVTKMVAKDSITPQDVEAAYKVVDIIKDIDTIKAMEEYEEDDDEHSSRGYSNRRMSMDNGMSYRRGRDSRTGRYVSRDNGSYNSYRYSRDEARDRIMDRLEEALEDATTERERQAIVSCMEKM